MELEAIIKRLEHDFFREKPTMKAKRPVNLNVQTNGLQELIVNAKIRQRESYLTQMESQKARLQQLHQSDSFDIKV